MSSGVGSGVGGGGAGGGSGAGGGGAGRGAGGGSGAGRGGAGRGAGAFGEAAAPEHEKVYRRVVRRETRVSRSAAVSVTMTVLLLVCIAVVVVASVVLLGQWILGVDPRAVVDAAARAPRGLLPWALAVGGGIVAALGLVLVLQGLLPQRRARHSAPSRRLAVVIDDEVIASALARAARGSTRLGPDAVVASVGRRRADVVLRPAAGVDAPVLAASDAVEAETETIAAIPALAAQVRVQPTGRVDG